MNASCQKEHWKVHKTENRKIQKALDSVKNKGEEDDDSKSCSKNKTSSPTIFDSNCIATIKSMEK